MDKTAEMRRHIAELAQVVRDLAWHIETIHRNNGQNTAGELESIQESMTRLMEESRKVEEETA